MRTCVQGVLLVVASLSVSYLPLRAETSAIISPNGIFHAMLDPSTNTIFSCEVRGADILVWRVDGIPAEDERIRRNRGITVTGVVTLSNSDLQGNLTIPNTMANNRTTMTCVAKNIHPPEISSDPAILQLLTQKLSNDPVISDSINSSTVSRLGTTTASMSSAGTFFSPSGIMITFTAKISVSF